MTKEYLINQIFTKRSYLCIGLDTDIEKIPVHLRSHPDPIFEFNKQIIDATKDHCVSYKINTAFYEAIGVKGWEAMGKTVNYIPSTHFKIADAKRGDIGNTSSQYAKAFFETLPFDAITVAPYMGEDSIKPFLEYKNKWTIVLGLTSNKGSKDFQQQKIKDEFLYETVLHTVSKWGSSDNLMFVTGATKSDQFLQIRKIIPDNFLLVPGVGTQGGSLKEVSQHGMTNDCGLLINVSRAIIYASITETFAEDSANAAKEYQQQMSRLLPG
ncbi:orotidine-5'-phosphate decarboxylase [soil metagenome]